MSLHAQSQMGVSTACSNKQFALILASGLFDFQSERLMDDIEVFLL